MYLFFYNVNNLLKLLYCFIYTWEKCINFSVLICLFFYFQTELSHNLQQLSEKARSTTEFIQRLKGMSDKVTVSSNYNLFSLNVIVYFFILFFLSFYVSYIIYDIREIAIINFLSKTYSICNRIHKNINCINMT